MDGTGLLFGEFVAALPSSFVTVTANYPTDRHLTNSEMQRLIREVCPVVEPFTLLAESFSTPLAIQYAAARPTNLSGLILCAGFATSPLPGWKGSLASLVAPLVFARGVPDLAVRALVLDRNASANRVAHFHQVISSVRPQVLAKRLRDLLGCDVQKELSKVSVPILYIQAKRDRLVSASCVATIKDAKPETSVVVVDAPHLLLQSEPHQTADAIGKFCAQHQ